MTSQETDKEPDGWWTKNRTQMDAALRVLFGMMWIIDGAMKFALVSSSDAPDLVQGAGQGQPAWLAQWFNFWSGVVSANPSLFLYGIGALELVVGIFLVVGFTRRTVYVGGIALSLMIWAVDEGFGGAYGPGSTDTGAAVVYAVVFFALLVIDAFGGPSPYSVDAWVERRLSSWRRQAETARPVPRDARA